MGPMSELSRWRPRKVYCTGKEDHSDEPGELHVVKFRQAQPGAAALVCEVVCHGLLEAAGIATLDARLVHVSAAYGKSCEQKPEIPYKVVVGLHFGTVLRTDVENGPPLSIDDLADPQELLDIWVLDSWLANVDREIEGNLLLSLGENGKFHLIAADQSDCLCGSETLCSGGWSQAMRSRGAASTVPFWNRAVYHCGGGKALRKALDRADKAAKKLDAALSRVPEAWWHEAHLDADSIRTELDRRYRRLEEIIELKQWEGLKNATQGGKLLDL